MCTNITKLDKCNKFYKTYNMYKMYKMQILRVAQDDRTGVLYQDRWWSHTACFDPRLFSVIPGLIGDPGSLLCHAGFRPRATKFLREARSPRFLRLRFLRLRSGQAGQALRSNRPRPHIEFAGPGRSPARRRREVASAFLVMRNNGTGFPVKLAALCCHCGFGHHLAVGADFRGRRLPADGAGAEVLTILFGNLAGCFMLFGLTIQKGQIEGMLGSR